MKTKPAILTALLACAVLPLRAQNAPAASPPTLLDATQSGGPRALPVLPTAELPPPVPVNPTVRAGSAESAPLPQAFVPVPVGGYALPAPLAPGAPQPATGGGSYPALTSDVWAPFVSNGPAPSGGQIEMRVLQIELDVALKQYEKIASALAETQSSMELLDGDVLGDVQLKELRNRAEEKLARLAQIKDRLRAEIMRTDLDLEALRKKSGTTAAAPVPAAGGFGLAPGSARR